jgi:hypothetical protein
MVDVSENAGSFEFGVPQFLFEMRANVCNSRNSYIPSRDGKRCLMNVLLDADAAPINIVPLANRRAVGLTVQCALVRALPRRDASFHVELGAGLCIRAAKQIKSVTRARNRAVGSSGTWDNQKVGNL